ncbi:MAG: glycoside hydrolase family 38 N-terminal domain-containing protein [Planctomycetota bacterium]
MPAAIATSRTATAPLLPALVLLAAFAPACLATGGAGWLAGYARDLEGEVIEYESALPEVGSALLVRSIDARRSIAWESEPVPASGGDRVTIGWMFGVDANPEQHRFELRIDGTPCLEFRNPAAPSLEPWTVEGRGGARLTFRPTRIDRHEDLFGFATLELPRSAVAPGRPVRFAVVGESAGSRVWYMTFRAAPRAGARVVTLPAIRRGADGPRQVLALEIVHLDEPAAVVIEPSFAPSRRTRLAFGYNRFELDLPPVREPRDERVTVRADGGVAWDVPCRVEPVRPWVIHLVQHSHTDIGYTRPQTEILPEHLRYIDYVLDYCDATDSWPDDARFRWTCEASYPVQEYVRTRPPAQIERLRRRVAEGRVELTALFANGSELLDERSCAASLEPLRAIRDAGLPVTIAMQNDVNGIAWCFPDLLAPLGVRHLVMGQHGHRALIPFDRPTAFWWESPAGARLLAWRADHYMTGNRWGLHGGRLDAVAPELLRYLRTLEATDYPWDRVAVQYSGVFIDNSPPGTTACDLMRRWNDRYVWPRLRSSTAGEFLRWVEAEHGADLPVHRQAWPDWWSDGVGSAPREAATARIAQGRLTAVEGLLAMSTLLGTPVPATVLDRIDAARQRLVLYGEHTYGAAESVSDPDGENSMVQWAEKAAYVWDAVKETALLEEAAMGLLQPRLHRDDVPTITVFNTLGQARGGLARVYVDHELLPPGAAFRITDEAGAAAPVQPLRRLPDGTWWGIRVEDVPPMGYRTYRLERAEDDRAPGAVAIAASESPESVRLESSHYRLLVDPRRGAVTSLLDKVRGVELVDATAPWSFGQLVQETLGDRNQLERFTLESCEREAAVVDRVALADDGPVWRSVVIEGRLPMAPRRGGTRLEIRLHAAEPRLELHYSVRKRPAVAPEGLYAALPFGLESATTTYETAGGAAEPGRDLLPGTASDWQAVQGFVSFNGERARVLVSSPDVLLFQLGGLNLGRFETVARVERPHAYAWLLNNYWVTNFLASEEGELRWSIVVTSTSPTAPPSTAGRFGLAEHVPLLARVLPALPRSDRRAREASLLQLSPPGVVLIGARPARAGGDVLLHVREADGAAARLRAMAGAPVPSAAMPVRRANALGDPVGDAAPTLPLRPGETAFVRLERR